MKTSFYYKVLNFDKAKLVSISRTCPEWFPQSQQVFELMPSWKLLKAFKEEKINEQQYCEIYRQQLSKLNAKEIYEKIIHQYGEDCILLCWCSVNDFCHRHLVSEWFEKELGIRVQELGSSIYERKDGRLTKVELQGELFC